MSTQSQFRSLVSSTRCDWLVAAGGAGLAGAAQSNKGGDSLQRSNYRVIYQRGMGLKAQWMAALGK